jgi:transcriptional regulator with XRE-family HTH domain
MNYRGGSGPPPKRDAQLIDLARPAEESRSPLAAARLRRQLTVDEAARRAGIPPDQVRWLEQGRVYRFRTSDEALAATLVYASALGVEHREARELAGLPVPPKPLARSNRGRLIVLGALAAAVVVFAGFLTLPGGEDAQAQRPFAEVAAKLPPAWTVSVDVLNGNGDINWTRRVASRIGALAYEIRHVGRADRFDYTQTAVYYERGGRDVAVRLARQLGVVTKPLPGGKNPKRLVVVVGPRRGPG